MKVKMTTLILISLAVAVTIALIALLAFYFTFGSTDAKNHSLMNQPDRDGEFVVTPNETESVKLAVGKVLTAENGYSKSVTVTASIYPNDVPDKSVDWTIEWFDDTVSVDVTEYVTITPESDGALTATITCYKPFSGDILVTVISRVGKVAGTCRVTYEGAPTSIKVATSAIEATPNENIGSFYGLYTGNTYAFDITPSNDFGDVRAECNYTYSVSAVGNLLTQDYIYNGYEETRTWIDGTEGSVAISSITKVNNYTPSVWDFSLSGNRLSIVSNSTLRGYYSSSKRLGQQATYYDYFKSYENDNWYYFVTVTETNTGVSETVKIRPVASINTIAIQDSVVRF